jgi:RimJ/RimL family protein N-acetyltransferase
VSYFGASFRQSERLRYERLTADHATALHRVLADARVYACLGAQPPSLAAMTAEFAERARGPSPARALREHWLNVAVSCRPTPGADNSGNLVAPTYIGRLEATIYRDPTPWAEVAYLFGVPWWGQGLAHEAMRWWLTQLSDGGVRVVWAAVAPPNARSLRLLQRLGFHERPASVAPSLGSYDAGDRVLRYDA